MHVEKQPVPTTKQPLHFSFSWQSSTCAATTQTAKHAKELPLSQKPIGKSARGRMLMSNGREQPLHRDSERMEIVYTLIYKSQAYVESLPLFWDFAHSMCSSEQRGMEETPMRHWWGTAWDYPSTIFLTWTQQLRPQTLISRRLPLSWMMFECLRWLTASQNLSLQTSQLSHTEALTKARYFSRLMLDPNFP